MVPAAIPRQKMRANDVRRFRVERLEAMKFTDDELVTPTTAPLHPRNAQPRRTDHACHLVIGRAPSSRVGDGVARDPNDDIEGRGEGREMVNAVAGSATLYIVVSRFTHGKILPSKVINQQKLTNSLYGS